MHIVVSNAEQKYLLSYWFSLCRICAAHRHLGQVPSACRSLGCLLQGIQLWGGCFRREGCRVAHEWVMAAEAPGSGSCRDEGVGHAKVAPRAPGCGCLFSSSGFTGHEGLRAPSQRGTPSLSPDTHCWTLQCLLAQSSCRVHSALSSLTSSTWR